MEYPNSRLVDPSSYDTNLDGLCTNIPVRVNHNAELADRGAFRAQKDWELALGSLPPGYAGTPGPQCNFTPSLITELLPDRIELVSYIIELTFLLDDVVDAADAPLAASVPYLAEIWHASRLAMTGGELEGSSFSPFGRMAVGLCKGMVAVDPELARTAFRWMTKDRELVLSRADAEMEFADLDEYLEYRHVSAASGGLFGMFLFGMGLSIPEDEQETCLELSRPFWLQFALANDYHSFEREQQAAIDNGQALVTNAVWVLMNRHSMTCDEAKRVCSEKARQYGADFVQVVEEAKARPDLCENAKFLLDIQRFGMSGNALWGSECPRYHPDRELNPMQLQVAKAVYADEAIGWSCGLRKVVSMFAAPPDVESNEIVTNGITNGPKGASDEVFTNNAVTNAVTNAVVNGAINDVTHRNVNGAITNGVVTNHCGHQELAAAREVPQLGTEALDAPSLYLDSLPAKGIRNIAIDALNTWFKVAPAKVATVKRVVNLLHGASLMLDDIQDSSQLRRGRPAIHLVFGPMQTFNTAGYRSLLSMMEIRKLGSEPCLEIFCEELQALYIGQSHDLSWTFGLSCPTEDEYLAMVDGKTAGLFRMPARLLDAMSNSPTKPDVTLLIRFMTLVGRLFQIRDDYMNLTSANYTKQKGFCEDLDEGKFSLPLIHALGRSKQLGAPKAAAMETTLLWNLLSQRHIAGSMSLDQKKLFLEQLQGRGSLEYTRQAVQELQTEMKGLAEEMGMHMNEELRLLLEVLKV